MIKAVIFDLDGVIVDSARFHFIAWKKLADELSIPFGQDDNERLKGVSREASLDIILSLSPRPLHLTDQQKADLCARKNDRYVELIRSIQSEDMLPGVLRFIQECRASGLKTAIASASRNAPAIIRSLQAKKYFDTIVDGNSVSKAKPHPQVFLQAAINLEEDPEKCVVFEDASAGVEAAIAAGMKCIGIGDSTTLLRANRVIPGFEDFHLKDLLSL